MKYIFVGDFRAWNRPPAVQIEMSLSVWGCSQRTGNKKRPPWGGRPLLKAGSCDKICKLVGYGVLWGGLHILFEIKFMIRFGEVPLA